MGAIYWRQIKPPNLADRLIDDFSLRWTFAIAITEDQSIKVDINGTNSTIWHWEVSIYWMHEAHCDVCTVYTQPKKITSCLLMLSSDGASPMLSFILYTWINSFNPISGHLLTYCMASKTYKQHVRRIYNMDEANRFMKCFLLDLFLCDNILDWFLCLIVEVFKK